MMHLARILLNFNEQRGSCSLSFQREFVSHIQRLLRDYTVSGAPADIVELYRQAQRLVALLAAQIGESERCSEGGEQREDAPSLELFARDAAVGDNNDSVCHVRGCLRGGSRSAI